MVACVLHGESESARFVWGPIVRRTNFADWCAGGRSVSSSLVGGRGAEFDEGLAARSLIEQTVAVVDARHDLDCVSDGIFRAKVEVDVLETAARPILGEWRREER